MDVKTVCLAILSVSDTTGYEIRKHFEDGPFAYMYEAGYGSIYPALNKLNEEGLVTVRDVPQEGKPDKKVYSINDAGRAQLKDAINQRPEHDRLRSDFLVMMLFAHLLDSKNRQEAYDTYLNFHRRHLAEMKGEIDGVCSQVGECFDSLPGHDFAHGFGVAVYTAIVDYLEQNRHLLFKEENDAAAE